MPDSRLALIRTRVAAEAALVDADPAYEREPIGKGCLPVRREDVEWLLTHVTGLREALMGVANWHNPEKTSGCWCDAEDAHAHEPWCVAARAALEEKSE